MLYASTYKCVDCHGDRGEGSQTAPPLAGISAKKSPADISAFLQNPSEPALDAGMPTIAAGSPDLSALIAYVLSLQP
jgi:mono/diheme cytochrome c family protein